MNPFQPFLDALNQRAETDPTIYDRVLPFLEFMVGERTWDDAVGAVAAYGGNLNG